jgi:hypothetical protein
MIKDKGGKALKEAQNSDDKKDLSDYQAGKTNSYKIEVLSTTKKQN